MFFSLPCNREFGALWCHRALKMTSGLEDCMLSPITGAEAAIGLHALAGRHLLTEKSPALQEMLRDTARGGAGTNRMMSYITDAAPQTGEATMRAGLHAEVGSCPCPALKCAETCSGQRQHVLRTKV